MAQLEHRPLHQRWRVQFLVRAHTQVAGTSTWSGCHVGGNPSMFLFLTLLHNIIFHGCLGTHHKKYLFNQSFIIQHLGCFPVQKNILQVKERIAFWGKQSPGQQKKVPAAVSFPFLTPSRGVSAQAFQTFPGTPPGPRASWPLPQMFPQGRAEVLVGLSRPWDLFPAQNTI